MVSRIYDYNIADFEVFEAASQPQFRHYQLYFRTSYNNKINFQNNHKCSSKSWLESHTNPSKY